MELLYVAMIPVLLVSNIDCLPSRSKRDTSTSLETLIAKYSSFRIKESPEYASSLGIHDYEDKITELTETAFTRQRDEAKRLLDEAIELSMDGLSSQERVSVRLLRATLSSFVEGYQYRIHSTYNMLSPLESPTDYFNGLFGSCCRYDTENDFKNALKRMTLLSQYVQQRKSLMNEAISLGTTAHNTSLTGIVDKINHEIVTDPENSSPYNSVFNRTKPNGISQDTWEKLKSEGKNITLEVVVPSWTDFKDFLQNTYSPNTRKGHGVGSLPNGTAYYQLCLRWHLTIDMTADEVHQKGLDEVDRIMTLMQKEMDKEGYKGSLQEYIAYLKTLQSNFFATEEEMLDGYREIIANIKQHIPSLVNNGPVSDCRVQKNPDPQGVLGMYSSPNENRPYGIFWANVYEPHLKPKSDMIALTIHEAEPGHHTQNAYVYERLGHLPQFRRKLYSLALSSVPFDWPFFTSYGEGWALYSEALGEGIGAYDWPHSLFGRYASEIFRAVRLVVDTGIHSKGWTKEQAMAYIANYTTFTNKSIENEVNRYISWPGQACAYKIGQLKIESLRAKASQELGTLFDLREFHEEVLRYGRIPLDVLEILIDEWIMEKKETQNPKEFLYQIIDEYITWRARINPEYATYLGIHDRDDRITELTEESFIKQKNEAEVLLQKTTFIKDDGLSRQDKIHYRVLVDFLQTFVDGFQFRKHSIYNMLSPLDSPVSYWNSVLSSLTYKTEDDYRLRAFERLKAIESWVDQRIYLMNEAIALNLTSHATALTGLFEKIDEEIVEKPEDSSVYKRFFNRTKPDEIAEDIWNQLMIDGANLTMEIYIPSWIRFKNYLNETYLKHTRPKEGIGSLTDGDAFYQSCLNYYTTVDISADEVHDLGLREVERIGALMEREMRKYNHTGTLQSFIEVIRSDTKNFFNTGEEMLEGYRKIIADTHSQMQIFFNNIPVSECRVVNNTDPQGVIGSYSGPSSSRPYGVFRANVFEPKTKPKSEMAALTMHEAEPGHHTQIAYHFEKLTDMPTFRRSTYSYPRCAAPFNWPRFAACSEGWALYAEALGEEMGAYEEPYTLFGRYESEMFRALRLVVDTGIHVKGWTKQQAKDYIGNYSTSAPSSIENEVNRYISWPGQACAYKIGQLKIEQLRDRAILKLDELFDLREFHDQIMQLGRVPLRIIEEAIDDWIQEILDSQDNKKKAQQLYAEFLEWRFEDDPEYGTGYGIHTYDHLISQWTEEIFVERMEKASKFKQRARHISRLGLDDLDQLHLDVLEEHLGYFINGFAFRKYSTYNAIAPLEPPTSDWKFFMSTLKYDTVSDYNKAFLRLSQLGTYVDQRIHLLNQSIANGLTLHSVSLTGIPEKMAEETVTNPKNSSYFKVMFDRKQPTGISDEKWIELRSEAEGIITSIVSPGWARFRQFLVEEYQPKTREWEGVWSLPGGIEFYQECLRFHTTTNLSPLDIHRIGLAEVEKIGGEMSKIMKNAGFEGTIQEYIEYLKEDEINFYKTGDEKIQGYESIIDDMHSKLDSILLTIPTMPIEVVASTNPQSAGGSYSTPPLDGSRNGTFTANVFYPETKPKFDMPSLTLHEAEPGHHTQLTYSIEQGIPTFRAIQEYGTGGSVPFGWPYYTGYVEGWALYAESLGIEMGAYDENKWPHSLFGMYASEMFRACRLVVDTGIHAFGWSKQEGIDYFLKYTTDPLSSIENEINRYISWPGQACGYKIGQMRILELRQRAIDSLGDKYDLREFNDEVLKVGAAPLSILERRIDAWILSKSSTLSPSSSPTTPATGDSARNQPCILILAFTGILMTIKLYI